jgi:hypothetical protein
MTLFHYYKLFQLLIMELKHFFILNAMNDGYVLVELKPTQRFACYDIKI